MEHFVGLKIKEKTPRIRENLIKLMLWHSMLNVFQNKEVEPTHGVLSVEQSTVLAHVESRDSWSILRTPNFEDSSFRRVNHKKVCLLGRFF